VLLSVWLIAYPIDPSSVRLAATPRSRSAHAVLHLSPRAHGLDPAHAIRALCRRRVRRADLDLHRGHVRHRRYRHGENLVAHDLRKGQSRNPTSPPRPTSPRSRPATAPSSTSGSTVSTSAPTRTRC